MYIPYISIGMCCICIIAEVAWWCNLHINADVLFGGSWRYGSGRVLYDIQSVKQNAVIVFPSERIAVPHGMNIDDMFHNAPLLNLNFSHRYMNYRHRQIILKML